MKKIILLTIISFISILGYSQVVLMDAVAATASGDYYDPAYKVIHITNGSVQIYTSSTFNGTTSTITLRVSNWASYNRVATAMQNDGTTPMTITLSSPNTTYTFQLQTVNFYYYELSYSKGNATLGTIDAVMCIQ